MASNSGATSKRDNKKIVTNMKEVISSTMKKARHEHRRKKENIKKLEPEITDISSIMNDALNIVSPNVSVDECDNKAPLKENLTQSNSAKANKKRNKSGDRISNVKSPLNSESIMNHFLPKPKETNSETSIDQEESEQDKQSKKLNAFEVMMNARNKTIGSNTPGNEPEQNDFEQGGEGSMGMTTKRKLMLEEWAAKKGALKRKLDDEARGEYIEQEMRKRAKRFKGMLVNSAEPNISKVNIKTNSRTKLSLKRKNAKTNSSPEGNESEELEIQTKKKSEKEKTTKTIKKRKARRLSSADSLDLNNSDNGQNKDEEFVSKLSSPLKKRDSLLGYFQKVVSPTTSNLEGDEKASQNQKDKESGKKLARDEKISKMNNKRKSKITERPENSLTPKTAPTIAQSSSGRPKRSCAGKARYDYDLEVSPKKEDDITKVRVKREYRRNSQRKISQSDSKDEVVDEKDNIECVVIELENSREDGCETSSEPPKMSGVVKKLAPVFLKALPKPSPDPELVKARQDFLMSGVPEKMAKEIAKQRQYEQAYEAAIEYFPKISHVSQLKKVEVDQILDVDWGKCKLTWRANTESPPSKKCWTSKCKSTKLLESPSSPKLFPLQMLPMIENKRKVVKQLKAKYDKFPTYRCYNQLREKYRSFSAKDTDLDTHQLTESFVVTRSTRRSKKKPEAMNSEEDEKPPPLAPNGELLFTEKYKPMSSDQVLVNFSPVNSLKEFLSSWQIGRNFKDNDSMCDFELTNDSSSNSAGVCNSVVLLGPSSSGKTSAVFALANELNFNVLEINAGMKRTGKKLLQELHEATQSHQVSKDNAKNGLLKKSLNGLKKNSNNLNDSNSSLDQNNGGKVSLILVEDADIVFEQDAGFVEAIYQLSASSKRPVIITANNPNCQHLLKLINQRVINFQTPNVLNISKFLSVLSLIENCPIDLNDIVSLYLFNNKNLRKTLLEMQFFIQSGGDRIGNKSSSHFTATSPQKLSEEKEEIKKDDQDDECETSVTSCAKIYTHRTLFEFYTTCQNINRRIPFPIDYNILWQNLSDIFKVSQKLQNKLSPKLHARRIYQGKRKKVEKCDEALASLEDFYENISVAIHTNSGIASEDFCCPSLSDEISHYLVEKSLKVNLNAGMASYNLFSKDPERISLTACIPTNLLRSQRSIALEYEPCLRTICRSEKSRSQLERRGSRFYHYLRNTCTNVSSFTTELFDSSCSVLMVGKDPI